MHAEELTFDMAKKLEELQIEVQNGCPKPQLAPCMETGRTVEPSAVQPPKNVNINVSWSNNLVKIEFSEAISDATMSPKNARAFAEAVRQASHRAEFKGKKAKKG